MSRISLVLIQFLLFNSFAPFSVASDPVTGPPTWIVDAQIVTDASHGQQEFTGTILNWSESQQTFAQPLTKQIGSNKVRMGNTTLTRSVFMLTSERITATLDALKFSRLDGSIVKLADLEGVLATKRAFAFVAKGSDIHPSIVASLHPDTIVITRKAYETDPVVIPLPDVQ
jgi:hypothetical protein